MARSVEDNKIKTREARRRLSPRRHPYFREIAEGLHIGYRRLKDTSGSWIVREYVGERKYRERSIGIADDYLDSDGKRVLNFNEAQEKARKRHSEQSALLAEKPVTVKEVMDDYLGFLRSKRKGAANAESAVEAFIIPQFGTRPVQSLTPQELESFLATLAAAPRRMRTRPGEPQRFYAAANDDDSKRKRKVTANGIFIVLRAALNRAYRLRLVTNDHAWRTVELFKNVKIPRSRFLSIAESKRLVVACDPEFRLLVQAALLSGARYGELTRLTAGDFHAESGTIEVKISKSGKSRHVELTDEGISFFATAAKDKAIDDPLFRRPNGEPWGKDHQHWYMARASERAKIEPRICFHGLRHTWASHAIMNGVPLVVAARNLGHADTTMVERVYGHLSSSFVRSAIRAQGPQFGFGK